MKFEEKDIDINDVPDGVIFKYKDQTYTKTGYTNNCYSCVDITDIKEKIIPFYTKVKVNSFTYDSIKKYKNQQNQNFTDFQKDNKDIQIERILDLPFGELKKKENTPEVRALIRIIKRFPFILDVAENKYDPEYASMALIKSMFEKFSTSQLVELFKIEESPYEKGKGDPNCEDKWHVKGNPDTDTCPTCGMGFSKD